MSLHPTALLGKTTTPISILRRSYSILVLSEFSRTGDIDRSIGQSKEFIGIGTTGPLYNPTGILVQYLINKINKFAEN